MKTKNFEVKIYRSGFNTYKVKAKSEAEAIEKARKLPINRQEVLNNLENWKEADTAEEVKKYAKDSKQNPI